MRANSNGVSEAEEGSEALNMNYAPAPQCHVLPKAFLKTLVVDKDSLELLTPLRDTIQVCVGVCARMCTNNTHTLTKFVY